MAGASLLAVTLQLHRGSTWFAVLGVLTAVVWVGGALWSGPIPLRSAQPRPAQGLVPAALIGVAAFAGFAAASEAARHLPVLSGALSSVLGKADATPLGLVLLVTLANGLGEEVFFRGAIHALVASGRFTTSAASASKAAGLVTAVLYVLVTLATGNAALVVAAVIMGAVFGLERMASGGVLAPIVTHLTWSALMVLALPR